MDPTYCRSDRWVCGKLIEGEEKARLAAEESLREAFAERMKERGFYQTLCQKLDKGEYRMKKDQLFRRLQVERDERTLQECICKAEQDKCKRDRNIVQEVNFAEAIKDLKEEEVREAACRKQLLACAPEIRDLEHEIRRAYYAKTLYAQRLEREAKKLEEKTHQHEMHQMLMENLGKFDADLSKKAELDAQKKRDYFKALKNQLEDATSKIAKKAEEYSRDKQMVDEIIDTIKQEEIQDLIEKHEKVKLYQTEIKHFLDSREFHREREKQMKQLEEQNISKFLETKQEQQAAYEKAKAERDAAKAAIVAKAIERIMSDQFRNEELDELRRELYEEELAADVKRREEEEKQKRYNQLIELRAAEAEAKRLRAEKLAADKQEEEDFRKQLIAKFAEDDRLEQLSYQKRRQKEIEHRKKVEEMIIERRAQKAEERERDLETRRCFDEETQRRKDIIERERLKLIREHGPKLLGFIPKGVIQSQTELEKLGEPFLSYYRNQPRAPDPTTIDASECEEEIFRNMEIPRYAKY